MFFKVTKQTKANEAAQSWRNSYFIVDDETETYEWMDLNNFNVVSVYEELSALPFPKDIDKVAEIIGNKCWTSIECYFCNTIKEKGIAISTEYLGAHEIICEDCLKEALKLLK